MRRDIFVTALCTDKQSERVNKCKRNACGLGKGTRGAKNLHGGAPHALQPKHAATMYFAEARERG